MSNPNSPLKLTVIINKITDATNFYIKDNEYKELCDVLRQTDLELNHYVFIEMHAKDGVDWLRTIPVMGKVLSKMQEIGIASKLHDWHYISKNDPKLLPELTELSKEFYLYINRITKETIL
jgi:hypothetical protein